MGSHFSISRILLVLMFTVLLLNTFSARGYSTFPRRFSKTSSKVHRHQTLAAFRDGQERSKNWAISSKLVPLTYDEKFAYGCLHEIPIPNTTLDTTVKPQQERAVLMEIFNQTRGHSWYNSSNWGNHSVSHCLWYGVTCDNTSRYVISLFLTNNNLVGTLPRSLWMLRNLQGLCIGSNDGLEGDIGEILSANMTTVLRVDLAFNKLSGQIPGKILVQMNSLVKIQLCCQMEGKLSGKIPEDIGNLSELQVLSLGENTLHGKIPKSIGKLKKLQFLDLEGTINLQGGFENLFNLSSLRYMHLSLAGLSGTLPDKFGLYFPAMIECLLSENFFWGDIPSTIDNMANLRYLNLANNRFTGLIPKGIGSIPMLQIVDLRENRLTSLEKGLQFKSQSLEVMVLAGNKELTMRFDDFLASIRPINQSLRILNISLCHFFGTIPSKLWDFQSFISVDLSGNNISGELPPPPSNMLFLLSLVVSANNLSGQIPQQFGKLLALETLDVSKNPHMQKKNESGALPIYITLDLRTLKRRNPSDRFRCPNARLSYNNGLVILDPSYYHYRLCICDIGFYGSGNTCLPCMEGAVCKHEMLHFQNMVIKAGYWPSSRDNNVTHMIRCSQVMGTSSQVITSCNPHGICYCGIKWEEDGNKSLSRLTTVCKDSCICMKGSKDRFCSKCERGFYKQGILCFACPKSKTSVYILAALAVLTMALLTLAFSVFYENKRFLSVLFVFMQVILLAVLAMLRIIPGWLLELNVVALLIGLAGRGKAASGIFKIGVFYFQTLDALISSSDIWPEEVLEAQRFVSNVLNFRFSGLACVFPSLFTPLGGLIALILLPVICIASISLYYALANAILRFRGLLDRRFLLRNNCLHLSIVSLNLTYFPIVKKTASVLASCGDDSGYRYFLEAPWLQCNGPTYNLLLAFGWLALVIYVVGVPFAVFLPLLQKYVGKRDQLDPNEQETLDSWLGSIYLPYKKEYRSYFEIVFLLRRMLIAFSLSFIPRVLSFQTIAVCLVLIASLCFQLLFRPFQDSYQKISLENTAETLVLLTLHFSFMNIRYALLNPIRSSSIIWMLVVVNSIVLCGLVVCIILLLGRVPVVPANPHNPEEVRDQPSISREDPDTMSSPLIDNGNDNDKYGTFEEDA
ncbi:putative leucine-rich repeat-containing protein DDB_G0281931 [Montipora capricornis]|uniref:putative leucine-rich repeat-containing protein DDB_G0281931 n=1 Tax=Montipora capricornis TaxID=246305 RepID=UPI0035F1329F